MKIKKIKIENFRLLKNFELDLEDKLSLVIGKNNCGKTSLNLNLNTPDMTSNGNYEKRWRIINEDRYLIKAGGKMINQNTLKIKNSKNKASFHLSA